MRRHPKCPTSIAQRGIRVGWVGKHLTYCPGTAKSFHLGPNWLRVKGHTISVCKQCTPPALKPNTYIQTLTEYSPHSTFDLFILTARGALTVSRGCPLRGSSCDGLLPSWTLGNFTWQNARSALGVPISGPPHPTVAPVFATVAPEFSSTSSTYLIRWLPCATHGHVGTLPSSTLKPLALAHGSAASDLLAPSLQFASLSTYSNHARAPSAASSR